MIHEGDPSIAVRKHDLRRRVRAARDGLSAGMCATASRVIAARLDTLPELAAAGRIVAYAATGREVDLDEWLRGRLRAGVGVLLPWVEGMDLRLGAIGDLDGDVEPGWRGVREPRHAPGGAGEDPAGVDAAVVPGLAFDRAGRRLGQGGGHIDRLLARLPEGCPVVGVAFEVQVLPEGMIPVEPHDVAVRVVVTEAAVWRGGRTAR
jgi:5-formyltetrahydrofolate cyclo-ligase